MTAVDEIREVALPQGTIRYRERGSGTPLVFVHGLLVDGTLWRKVVPELADRHRCIVPDLPLGSHRVAMAPDADLSPPGLARLIADFLAALDLRDATVVANDTGGALTQILAANHPERIGRLVLTNCDAYENFFPPAFRPLQWIARVPGGVSSIALSLRSGVLRDSPLAYGMLTKGRIPREVTAGWAEGPSRDAGVRRDLRKVLLGIAPRHTLAAIERLRSYDKPVMLAWGADDPFFKPRFAERLAADIPTARLELIPACRTFVSEDQPKRLAELIAEPAAAPAQQKQPGAAAPS